MRRLVKAIQLDLLENVADMFLPQIWSGIMIIRPSGQNSAFSTWVRTGRWPIEKKFNPWHDPENGQFTHAGSGRYFSRGNNTARGFGGGGASGKINTETTDKNQRETVRRAARTKPKRATIEPITTRSEPAARSNNSLPVGQQNTVITRNGYRYEIDKAKRTRKVSGTVTENPEQRRSDKEQARAGGTDRRPTDHGGHFIARRFNGPTEAFNHFAQDADFNRGRYQAMENQWARGIRRGERVTVRIVPVYEGNSRRPSVLNIWYTIGRNTYSIKLPNEHRKKIS
ncbi:DNA/RNA non-specific endonuclease [Blastomonas fulva]|uniref:DNA/RNA non-specific endonuclease n=1 Tax=Blastomonas fulva TaxID=1550728 RepID=UPI003F720201